MCTGIRLKALDGTAVHARTLEFAVDILSDLIVVPKGYERVGSTPTIGKKLPLPGKKWTSKYASVGMSGLGLPVIFDGLNEVGLAIGLFFFPGFAEYMPYSPSDAENTIAPWEVGSWILENCKTVEQVRSEIINNIVVPNVIFAEFDPDAPPPVHFVVHDASGKSIVIEYVGGKPIVHDNPLGVITNSPTFDWHMTNLRNYVNFSFTNSPGMKLGSVQLSSLGQGSGMLGMPGDFTPPSRFVRAVAYSQSVSEEFNKESSEGEHFHATTGKEAILQAFHILNNFDIPKGVARENEHIEAGTKKTFVPADYTLWTSASDLKAKQYYFRTYENSQIRMVDLNAHKDRSLEIARISIAGEEKIQTVD
ncbi:linear amide C-N hydrolase [uncultured Nostoc sp.]|uniref:linear amide C-N hydrolase n=1 Tax=uncultured Nostoc sp. TaxID=340711 RepID=UPI0035CAC8F9